MGLKHLFALAAPPAANPALVDGPNWNDDHYFLDTAHAPIGAVGDLPYRGAAGLMTLLAGAQGVLQSAGAGQVPAYTMSPTLTSLVVTGAIAAGSLVLTGGITIDAPELGYLDGVIPGTVLASKAVVVDANKDIATFRNLTANTVTATVSLVLGAAADAVLARSAADQVDLTRGTNTQILRIGPSTNRLYLYASAAVAQIYTAGAFPLELGANNNVQWRISSSGHLLAINDNTYDIGANGATRPRTIHVGTDVTIGGSFTAISASRLNLTNDGLATLTNAAASGFNYLRLGANGAATGIRLINSAGALTVAAGDGTAGNILTAVDGNGNIGSAGARWQNGYFSIGLTIGTNPSSVGAIRLANGSGLYARNAANTADILLLSSTSADRIRVGNGTDVQWGMALVTLGGGAAPTLGTIGGSGPVAAAQNAWMRVIDTAGAVFWVPAWK